MFSGNSILVNHCNKYYIIYTFDIIYVESQKLLH